MPSSATKQKVYQQHFNFLSHLDQVIEDSEKELEILKDKKKK